MIRSCLSSTATLWSSRNVGWPTLAYVLLLLNEWPYVFLLCSRLAVGTAPYWGCLHHCLPPLSCRSAIDNVIRVSWLEIQCKVNAESFHNPFKYPSAQQCLVCRCSSELFLNRFFTSPMWETGWKSLLLVNRRSGWQVLPTFLTFKFLFLGLNVFIWRTGRGVAFVRLCQSE